MLMSVEYLSEYLQRPVDKRDTSLILTIPRSIRQVECIRGGQVQ